jgi:hypothetical protein
LRSFWLFSFLNGGFRRESASKSVRSAISVVFVVPLFVESNGNPFCNETTDKTSFWYLWNTTEIIRASWPFFLARLHHHPASGSRVMAENTTTLASSVDQRCLKRRFGSTTFCTNLGTTSISRLDANVNALLVHRVYPLRLWKIMFCDRKRASKALNNCNEN